MRHFAAQVKELVSSNLNALVESASNPSKMLRLLMAEVEENIIQLGTELSGAQRREERALELAERQDTRAEDWTAKAGTAMRHNREDLARSALLAREDTRSDAEKARADAASASGEAKELEAAIAQLETKLSETRERLKAETGAPSTPATDEPVAAAATPSLSAQVTDRIDKLEQRIGFSLAKDDAPAPTPLDAEIRGLEREAQIEAELAELKGQASPARKPKKK